MIKNIVKKVTAAFLIIYGINLIISNINIFVPINVVSVGVVSILGIPGLVSLISLSYIIK